ncbi:MAG TPA: hypothetical protein VMS64_26080 [Candidatus Methylomirabilis sp.]|nr:hypothetical protein [Candidatus Methylomirabilis sp.]
MRTSNVRLLTCLVLAAGVLCAGAPSMAQQTSSTASTDGVFGAIGKSLTGDVYSDPSKWRELSLSNFFTEGWTQAWVSPPNGGGGAPRQGWLNSFDGVFYRLGVGTYGYAHNFLDNGNQNSGLLQLYLPFDQRFEFRLDVPVVSNRGATGTDYEINFGDLQIVPRFLLSESQDFTQSFNVAFRVPTGKTENTNGAAAITPTYEFWANWWKGLVLRGGAGFFVPYGHQSIDEVGARASFIANLAAGYYFTPHTATPFGDLVFYLSANLVQTVDGPSKNTASLTPGMRTHLGENWYLLMGVEVPVTHKKAFDYQVLGALMKVF